VRPKPRGQVRKSGLVMAEKRKLEFDSLSGVSEVESADIHSVIASVSPMKKGKRASYFDCKLTNGEVQMKLIDLNLRNTFDKVCVEAKVVRVDGSVKVAGGISKQDVVIADSTPVVKITLWGMNSQYSISLLGQ